MRCIYVVLFLLGSICFAGMIYALGAAFVATPSCLSYALYCLGALATITAAAYAIRQKFPEEL